jgi:hypothetical protein
MYLTTREQHNPALLIRENQLKQATVVVAMGSEKGEIN